MLQHEELRAPSACSPAAQWDSRSDCVAIIRPLSFARLPHESSDVALRSRHRVAPGHRSVRVAKGCLHLRGERAGVRFDLRKEPAEIRRRAAQIADPHAGGREHAEQRREKARDRAAQMIPVGAGAVPAIA
jgi:hypothetical protein